MKKKRALTLLEIMIVIFLITLITGTIGYSFRGTLDKGRAFRTEQAIDQLRDLLLMSLAEGRADADALATNPKKYLVEGNLAKDPEKLIKDGWNQPFEIKVINKSNFKIKSKALDDYRAKTKTKSDTDENEES